MSSSTLSFLSENTLSTLESQFTEGNFQALPLLLLNLNLIHQQNPRYFKEHFQAAYKCMQLVAMAHGPDNPASAEELGLFRTVGTLRHDDLPRNLMLKGASKENRVQNATVYQLAIPLLLQRSASEEDSGGAYEYTVNCRPCNGSVLDALQRWVIDYAPDIDLGSLESFALPLNFYELGILHRFLGKHKLLDFAEGIKQLILKRAAASEDLQALDLLQQGFLRDKAFQAFLEGKGALEAPHGLCLPAHYLRLLAEPSGYQKQLQGDLAEVRVREEEKEQAMDLLPLFHNFLLQKAYPLGSSEGVALTLCSLEEGPKLPPHCHWGEECYHALYPPEFGVPFTLKVLPNIPRMIEEGDRDIQEAFLEYLRLLSLADPSHFSELFQNMKAWQGLKPKKVEKVQDQLNGYLDALYAIPVEAWPEGEQRNTLLRALRILKLLDSPPLSENKPLLVSKGLVQLDRRIWRLAGGPPLEEGEAEDGENTHYFDRRYMDLPRGGVQGFWNWVKAYAPSIEELDSVTASFDVRELFAFAVLAKDTGQEVLRLDLIERIKSRVDQVATRDQARQYLGLDWSRIADESELLELSAVALRTFLKRERKQPKNFQGQLMLPAGVVQDYFNDPEIAQEIQRQLGAVEIREDRDYVTLAQWALEHVCGSPPMDRIGAVFVSDTTPPIDPKLVPELRQLFPEMRAVYETGLNLTETEEGKELLIQGEPQVWESFAAPSLSHCLSLGTCKHLWWHLARAKLEPSDENSPSTQLRFSGIKREGFWENTLQKLAEAFSPDEWALTSPHPLRVSVTFGEEHVLYEILGDGSWIPIEFGEGE